MVQSRPLLRTFTAEEEAVIRQAAARMIKYGRYHRRRLRSKPGQHSRARYQGETTGQVLRAYTRNLRHWHELADAACALVQRVTGRGSGNPRSN